MAADKEAKASPLDKSGTRDNLKFLRVLHFDTKSQPYPTGHIYRQNQRFRMNEKTRTTNPKTFIKTKDFKTKTELSRIKGLNQAYNPVSPFQNRGRAKTTAKMVDISLILFDVKKWFFIPARPPGSSTIFLIFQHLCFLPFPSP